MSTRHAARIGFVAMVAAILPGAVAPAWAANAPVADELTRSLIREAEFQYVAVSPDGSKLAIARHVGTATTVTVHERDGLKPLISFDPGSQGAITGLRWLDDARLMVGATRMEKNYGFARFEPVLLVATLDGKSPSVMPGNFFATIEGDPGHILVSGCGFEGGGKGCNLPQIRRDDLKKLSREGDLVIEGPADTELTVNREANAAFAMKFEDDDTGRTYVYHPADKTWTLLNDGSAAGLEVYPLRVSRDGHAGFLQSERKDGPDLIERYDFATGQRTPLFAHPTSDPLQLVASLDGQEILGAYYQATAPELHLWLPDHPDAAILTQLQEAFPKRLVSIASASKDRNFLVLSVSSDREPGSWYLFDRQALKATALAPEFPWIDPARQGPMQAFTLKSRDGLELHGLLTLPPGSTGKHVPLVVMPHGGPFWVHDSWGYDPELQILAQHGYAVLQVNFRGSGGYGWQFASKGARQWGRAMQDDVTDATRWAIAEGIADPGRICIYGASYGGYAALMGPIREPGLYRCVASYAAPTDLPKLFRWGSLRRDDLGLRYLKRVLGDDPAELRAVSPARQAEKIDVPVLLAQGYLDARVDVKHAHAMSNALGRRKAPVEYVEYASTGHFLVLEKARLDFYARLLRFLDRNIGPAMGSEQVESGGAGSRNEAVSSRN